MMQLDCCEMVEQKKKNCRRNNTKQKETYLNCNYIVTTNRNNVTAEKSHWLDVGGRGGVRIGCTSIAINRS